MKIAVAGATGALGQEILATLEKVELDVEELVPLASRASSTPKVEFGGKALSVRDFDADSLEGVDVVFAALPRGEADALLEEAAEAGCMVVDLSGDTGEETPLLALGARVEDLQAARERSAVAIPGPAALALAALGMPVHEELGLRALRATVMLSASHAGKKGIEELSAQVAALMNGREPPRKHFPEGLAFDLHPNIGAVDGEGWTAIERRTVAQVARLLQLPPESFAVTIGLAPVFVGLAASVHVVADSPVDATDALALLLESPTLKRSKSLGLRAQAGRASVAVGRVRADPAGEGFHVWLACDPLRLTAANAVALVREMAESGLL